MYCEKNVEVGIREKAFKECVQRTLINADGITMDGFQTYKKSSTYVVELIDVENLPESLEELAEAIEDGIYTEEQVIKWLCAKIITESANNSRTKWNSPESKKVLKDAERARLLQECNEQVKLAKADGDIDRAFRIIESYNDKIAKL